MKKSLDVCPHTPKNDVVYIHHVNTEFNIDMINLIRLDTMIHWLWSPGTQTKCKRQTWSRQEHMDLCKLLVMLIQEE